jgi:hypothetical protein
MSETLKSINIGKLISGNKIQPGDCFQFGGLIISRETKQGKLGPYTQFIGSFGGQSVMTRDKKQVAVGPILATQLCVPGIAENVLNQSPDGSQFKVTLVAKANPKSPVGYEWVVESDSDEDDNIALKMLGAKANQKVAPKA